MPREEQREVESTAAVRSHPLHPMLVPFPIAYLIGALATDLAWWGLNDPFWLRASLWLIGAGLIMGVIAASFGLVDFITLPRVRRLTYGWMHFVGNIGVLSLAFANLLVRVNDEGDVIPWGLLLSAGTAVLIVVTAWLGGELIYHHRIAVKPR